MLPDLLVYMILVVYYLMYVRRYPPVGSRRSLPAGQCISSENPRLSLGAAAELEENYIRCGYGISESFLLSAPSASSGSQPWSAGQYYENQ